MVDIRFCSKLKIDKKNCRKLISDYGVIYMGLVSIVEILNVSYPMQVNGTWTIVS